jgi:MYXO-CTERM domain-containing protein
MSFLRLSASAFSALLLATLLAMPGVARAQRCEPARVVLTLDKSSSMLGGLPSGGTKWDAARSAIGSVARAYASRIDFGLQPFPFPDRCEPGRVTLEVGANSAEAIVAALGDPPPGAGNWTPMSQTLDALASYGPLRDAGAVRHVILITDGWQWCSPHDPVTRFDPVDSVGRLRELGVTVHVVGFGAAVDSLTLNRAAVAAGTELPGCDVTLSDPAAMNHCYAQANDLTDLEAALDAIATEITDEMCDAIDNDCDGTVDEGYDTDGDGYTTCGSHPDIDGTDPRYTDCVDTDPAIHPMAAESCDGVDNDCDGTADPGCACTGSEMRECGDAVGVCTAGTQVCTGGMWGPCTGASMPGPSETCDARDEDCDGRTDEGTTCGPAAACMYGECIDLTEPTEEPGEPIPDDPPADDPRPMLDPGCDCDADGPAPISTALLGVFVAAMLVRRRRR